MISMMDLGDRSRGQFTKLRGIEQLIWIYNIDQVMLNPLPLGQRWFARADVHMAINLLRIGVYYFSCDPGAQLEGKLALPYRGRTQNDDNPGLQCYTMRLKSRSSCSRLNSINTGRP